MLEFAIVAPMLILLMLTIIDLGIMLMNQSVLDGAARQAARYVRTGQLYTAGNSITVFRQQLCNGMASVMNPTNCNNNPTNLIFEVQTFPDYGSVSFTSCTQTSLQTGSGTVCPFSPGATSSIVGVRVVYNRAYIIPWVDKCLTTGQCWFGTGTRGASGGSSATVPLMSTVIFQNEPFPTTTG